MPAVITRVATGLFVLAGTVCFLRADSICVTGGACDANWQPFVTPIPHAQGPGPTGPVYFDGFSWDAPNANIAYFIEGQGFFLNSPVSPDARLPFWGNPNGSAVPSFYFQSDGESQVASLLLTSASWAPFNSLGWYDPDSAAWGWIFEADGTPPTVPESVEFTPTANFGLFFVPDNLNPTYNSSPSYYTNSSLNGIADADVAYAANNGITLEPGSEAAYQHFAVFDDSSGGYYIGVKDRSLQVGDGDYNDMVISLAPVPEPGYFPLIAALVATFPLWCRRVLAMTAR